MSSPWISRSKSPDQSHSIRAATCRWASLRTTGPDSVFAKGLPPTPQCAAAPGHAYSPRRGHQFPRGRDLVPRLPLRRFISLWKRSQVGHYRLGVFQCQPERRHGRLGSRTAPRFPFGKEPDRRLIRIAGKTGDRGGAGCPRRLGIGGTHRYGGALEELASN